MLEKFNLSDKDVPQILLDINDMQGGIKECQLSLIGI